MPSLLFAALLLVAPALPAAPPPSPPPGPLTATAFGAPVVIEVRDLPAERAEPAMQAALTEIQEIEALTSPADGGATGLPALNAAGAGAHTVDPRLVELLARAQAFCIWSQGAHGPLGGRLYRLWGLREPVAALPSTKDLVQAAAGADCSGLHVDLKALTVEVPAAARLDLYGFATGFAVDRAVGVLKESGAGDGRVAIGGVQRAFGPGPDGDGWRVDLPDPPGLVRPLTPIRLKDEALAVALAGANPLAIAGEHFSPYLDQRTGRPATGVAATAAVTELALDAQALAVSMFITGSREGSLRLGTLRPTPSVLWLLGSGSGNAAPILTDFHWSQVTLP
jgi:FAD:protein FMN transferase